MIWHSQGGSSSAKESSRLACPTPKRAFVDFVGEFGALSNRKPPDPEMGSAAPSAKGGGAKKESKRRAFGEDIYTKRRILAIQNCLPDPLNPGILGPLSDLIDALDDIEGDADFEDVVDPDREPWLAWTIGKDGCLHVDDRDLENDDDTGFGDEAATRSEEGNEDQWATIEQRLAARKARQTAERLLDRIGRPTPPDRLAGLLIEGASQ